MPSTALITRAEYMADSPNLFWPYYSQFATDATRRLVISAIGADRIRASRDPWFNDIPLREWDRLEPSVRATCNTRALGEAEGQPTGRYVWSLGTSGCIAKAVAHDLRNAAKEASDVK